MKISMFSALQVLACALKSKTPVLESPGQYREAVLLEKIRFKATLTHGWG